MATDSPRKYRLLYCASSISGYGGLARIITAKANYFADVLGYDVTIAVICMRGPLVYELSPRVRLIDMKLPVYGTSPWRRLINEFRIPGRLRRLVREINPDFTLSVATIKELSRLWKLPYGGIKIAEAHGSRALIVRDSLHPARIISNRCYHGTTTHSDAFVVLTERDAAAYRRHGVNPAVIPNAVPFTTQAKSPLTAPVVVYVGRIDLLKNVGDLIDIWALVAPQFPEWKLRIYGNGPEQESVRARILTLGLADSAQIAYTDNVRQAYMDASVSVTTSLSEGLSMALLEASECGVPSVAYDIDCGPDEVIADGVSGYVVPVGQKELFARRLSALMADGELRRRMGAAAAARMESEFSMPAVMDRWVKLFDNLIAKDTNV